MNKNEENNIMRVLAETARKEWLQVHHINKISKCLKTGEIDEACVHESIPFRPRIGEVFLVRKSTKKFWKKDGFSYKKRANGRGFQELSQRLGKDKSVLCLYSQINKDDKIYDDFWKKGTSNCLDEALLPDFYLRDRENEYLHRRIFIDMGRFGDKDIAIVQYFLKRGAFSKCDSLRKEDSTRIQSFFDESSLASKETERYKHNNDNQLCFLENTDSIFTSESKQIDDPKEHDTISVTNLSLNLNPEVRNLEESQNKRIQNLEQQVIFLMKRLNLLEGKKLPEELRLNQDQPKLRGKINDFSPEWDYTEGGSKVIICFETTRPVEMRGMDITVAFGDMEVQAEVIQNNVIKCNCPSFDSAGFVDLNILINGEYITSGREDKFEYKEQKLGKKSRDFAELQASDDDEMLDRLFKVRLVEKMNHVNNFGLGNSNSDFFSNFDSSEYYDKPCHHDDDSYEYDNEARYRFDDAKMKKYFENFFTEFKNSEKAQEAINLICDIDSHDFYLVHYLTKFSLIETLKYLKDQIDVDLGVKGKGDITCLHIALHENSEPVLEYLIQEGAFDLGETEDSKKLDLASLMNNKEKIENFLRKISLTESISNSYITEPEPSVECSASRDKEAEEIYFNLLDLLGKDAGERGGTIEVARIAERRRFLQRRRKARESENLKRLSDEDVKKLDRRLLEKILDGNINDKVKLIQKNVRGWIRRRHFMDVKYAVKVLERCKELLF